MPSIKTSIQLADTLGRPQIQAAAQGHQQILWLFGPEHYLTEVGTMNLFVVLENEAGGKLTNPLI